MRHVTDQRDMTHMIGQREIRSVTGQRDMRQGRVTIDICIHNVMMDGVATQC